MEENINKMKSIHQWFDEYGESHQNKTNKIIHWICIPLIFWSIIALLSLIPMDFLIKSNFIHWGTVVVIIGLIFYLRLSFKIFLGMFFVSFYVLWDVYFWHQIIGKSNLLIVSLVIFFLAWILQFIGHKIEGKKPSFIKDIQFLLIGPAWLLGFVYKKIGVKF